MFVFPSAGTEDPETVVVQTPLALVVAVAVAVPQTTVTVALASAVPEIVTPAALAAALITFDAPTALILGASGAVVSGVDPFVNTASAPNAATHP